MPRDESNSLGAKALRAAGYRKLPAWWATQEQLELIEYMVRQNKPEIDRIKREAHDAPSNTQTRPSRRAP